MERSTKWKCPTCHAWHLEPMAQRCAACQQDRAALAAAEQLDAIYASLSDEDAASLNQRDPDDPRTFALDSKGRP